MKIIIPDYVKEDTFTDNVVYTLRKLGHDVLTLPKLSSRIG